jgi:hypothetical protein
MVPARGPEFEFDRERVSDSPTDIPLFSAQLANRIQGCGSRGIGVLSACVASGSARLDAPAAKSLVGKRRPGAHKRDRAKRASSAHTKDRGNVHGSHHTA